MDDTTDHREDVAPAGVWVTFQYAACENCWDVRPHASELEALKFLATLSYPDRVQFVPFGEVLKP